MVIIIKHTFKNMIQKPFRTLLLLFCIAICSFTAMLSLDMTGTVDHVFRSLFGQLVGSADLVFESNSKVTSEMFEELPEHELVLFPTAGNQLTVRNDNPKLYSYMDSVRVTIFGVDFDEMYDMKVLRKEYNLSDSEMIISEKMAEQFDLEIGDTFTLYSDYKNPVEFTVSDIITEQGLFNQGTSVILSLDGMKKIKETEDLMAFEALIDLKDDSQAQKVKEQLEDKYPTATITLTSGAKEVQEATTQISQLFFVLFAICLLIVIFITITISEKIVIERMSVIGTLRSLGVSHRKTAGILLTENSLYGLLGSLIGVWIYSKIRLPMLTAMFSLEGSDLNLSIDFGATKMNVYIIIIVCAIILEDLCPLKSILHATKRSIRDIIFDNQDTEYQMGRSTKYVGFGLLALAIISAFFKKNFLMLLICLGCSVGALSVLFPFVIKGASILLQKLFLKRNKPIAHLAAIEMYGKKSNVSSARLAVTATSLALVLFVVAQSMTYYFSKPIYDCDVIASLKGEKALMYQYMERLDGVSDVEFVYVTTDYCTLNGEEKTLSIFGNNEYQAFQGVEDLPSELGEDEFVMDKYLAEELGFSIGDQVEIVIASQSFIPCKKTLTLSGLCNSTYYNSSGDSIVIPEKLYEEAYQDIPTYALLCCEDAEGIKQILKEYSAGTLSEVMTYEEYLQEVDEGNSGIKTILYALMIMSIVLTFIGTVSNQFVGFQGRKRECAVMVSVAMPRKKLARLFSYETLFSMTLVMLVSCPMSLLLAHIVMNIMEVLTLNIPVFVPQGQYVQLVVIIWLVFLVTSFFPRRSLRKMKIAEQLKYE